MVIGRGRRREHPQPTFCATTKKKGQKKIRENSTGKKVREKSMKKKYEKNTGNNMIKSTGKIIRGKTTRTNTGIKSTENKYGGEGGSKGKKYGKKYGKISTRKSHVTSGDVNSGQECARYHFRLLPIAHPLMLTELCSYTTDYIVFFLKCLLEHPEYMFIYLEGKYNSSKGNLIILGTI
jgi:hypothetical protein